MNKNQSNILKNKLSEYKRIESLKDLDINQAIQKLGNLINLSMDLENYEGFEKAIALEKTINKSRSENDNAAINYFISNAWQGIYNLKKKSVECSGDWNQPEIEKIIYHLRKAKIGTNGIGNINSCKIFTNLGNIFNSLGHFIEAIDLWDKSLIINPQYSMTLLNNAIGLKTYASYIYNPCYRYMFLNKARALLKASLEYDSFDRPFIRDNALYKYREIEEIIVRNKLDIKGDICVDKYSLGKTKIEIAYRKWCLDNKLFLNPLNDICKDNIAARDVLMLPGIYLNINEYPEELFYFNTIKQEYVSARYMLYEGIKGKANHFSDRDVLLSQSFDYQCYSYNLENIKNAFRISYSIFDKIAYFINFYFKLDIEEHRIKYLSIWYMNLEKKNGLLEVFKGDNNLPLKGLYWISKDLYEDKKEYKDSLDPEAKDIYIIRNYLEHKYLKINEYSTDGVFSYKKRKDIKYKAIQRDDFILKTIKLMKLARLAIMYLAFAIYYNESIGGINHKITIQSYVPNMDDRSKR